MRPTKARASPSFFEQFDWAAGGASRVVGKHPHCAGYQVQAAGEGIEKWEAMIVYPKQTLEVIPDPQRPQRRSSRRSPSSGAFTTRSTFHSGELNILKCCDPVWQPFCGIRYFRFDDELRILRRSGSGWTAAGRPWSRRHSVTITDMTNLFDLENNLFGFQGGLRHDFWRPNSRFAIEGFLNGGVYYNKIKYTNLMNTTVEQRTADDIDTEGNEFRDTTVVSQNIDAATSPKSPTVGRRRSPASAGSTSAGRCAPATRSCGSTASAWPTKRSSTRTTSSTTKRAACSSKAGTPASNAGGSRSRSADLIKPPLLVALRDSRRRRSSRELVVILFGRLSPQPQAAHQRAIVSSSAPNAFNRCCTSPCSSLGCGNRSSMWAKSRRSVNDFGFPLRRTQEITLPAITSAASRPERHQFVRPWQGSHGRTSTR